MKRHRGFGAVYQPTWKDKKTGKLRTAETWWVRYYAHGRRIVENAHATKEAEAIRLLKLRTG
jgi:hypothetical protein